MSRLSPELNASIGELARLRVSRRLVARAEEHHLREALDVHARSLFGRDIWQLDLNELAEIDITLSTLIEFLAGQVSVDRSATH